MSQSASVASPTRTAAGGSARALVADQLDPGGVEVGQDAGQELAGDRGVDQQRLGRVADPGALRPWR